MTPLISPNPAPDHIADFHLFLNIVRSTIRGGVSVQQRVFPFYNYLEEKDFLNYPKSPESKHELLKNTQISGKYITFSVLKYWFLSVIFGNGALRAMEVSA